MSNNATTHDARTALDNALQHLRQAMRLITATDRLLIAGDPQDTATQRCVTLYSDIAAAARSCANMIDHIDGYGPAMGRHPAVTDR